MSGTPQRTGALRASVLFCATALATASAQARPVDESPDEAGLAAKSKGDKPAKKKKGPGAPAPGQSPAASPPSSGSSPRPMSLPVNRGPAARPSSASRPASNRPATDGRSVKPSAAPERPDSVPAASPKGAPPAGATRAYESGASAERTPPPQRSTDHRYARPHSHHVRPAPHAGHPPPDWVYYRPYYARWYVHPYYRWLAATVIVVNFTFVVDPWLAVWVPPPRAGWTWVPGHYDALGFWVPGHWVPIGGPPTWYPHAHYVYVPGYWQGPVYVEGWWRTDARDGWIWQDGYYLSDGTYVSGHWEPAGPGPEGYVWEAGYFDGEEWTEGFWRPELRAGYTWVSAYFDESGIYHGGYWMPLEAQPGHTWIPGWFDGQQWVEGYWVSDQEYQSADPQSWIAPEGWNDGWDSVAAAPAATDDAPLALPVDVGGVPQK